MNDDDSPDWQTWIKDPSVQHVIGIIVLLVAILAASAAEWVRM